MKKLSSFFTILLLLILLSGCSRGPSGKWGLRDFVWGYQGKGADEVKFPLKNFSGFIIALESCSVNVNGEKKELPALHGIPVNYGDVVNLAEKNCKIIAMKDVVFKGEGGVEDRYYAILPEGVFLFGVKYIDTYRFFPLVYGGKFALPKGEFAFIKVYTKDEWKKLEDKLKKISYVEVGNSSFQVLHLFPGENRVFNTAGKKKVSFYTIVLSMLPPAGEIFPAPGVKFRVTARNKKRFEEIAEFQQQIGVKLHEMEIPSWAEEIEISSEGRDLGNLSFITNPYFYTPTRHPEIVVLISMDTVRAKSLEIYGGPPTAPYLSEFSSQCRVYERAYTPHPWTYDGHMAVFFSKYSWEKMGKSIAEAIQKKGYYTAAFTGGGLVAPHLGFARGFLLYHYRPFDIFDVNSSKRLYQSAVSFIEDNKEKSLFLFLHTYQAHSPYMAGGESFDVVAKVGGLSGIYSPLPDEEREKAKSLYEEEINRIDKEFLKPFITYLQEKKLYSRTHIIIFADHGEQFFEHGNWEHGYSLYEEEVHVPLLVKSSKFKPSKDSKLISLLNIWEIVAKITGIKKAPEWKLRRDWVILSTPISGENFHFPKNIGIIRGNMKLIRNLGIDRRFFRRLPKRPRLELYSLGKDPQELHNIYGTVKEGISLQRLLKPFVNFYMQGEGYKPSKKDIEKLRSLGYVE